MRGTQTHEARVARRRVLPCSPCSCAEALFGLPLSVLLRNVDKGLFTMLSKT